MGGLAFNLDSNYLSVIEEKFEQKRKIASAREQALFQVFDGNLTKEEETAMKFIYAYMSLNDLADYEGSLFLNHVRETFQILKMIPWGYKIPGSLFLHFVLPYRVNNENIEDCRGILFKELYNRVKDLSMTDAILEVNHWCHEKVTYIACDPRTSSPLTAIRRALGRCGEESTLAVSALRSLCIPARQCYTPRWAHCDDNHAWVEAWADGKWSYLGACEPDARLNNGWFRDPARRAMLVNTRVLGNYTGPEDITLSHEWYTELNLLDNYAPVKKITVKVTNREGNPIPGATVYFQVFNSGEFSTIARLTSDNNGKVSLTTGFGDLMVHAAGGNGWGNKKISVTKGDYFEISISEEPPVCGTQEIDMVPPAQTHADAEDPAKEELNTNNRRLNEEDRIRAEYEATFISETQAHEVARELSLPAGRVWDVLKKARGNSREIAAFLMEETPGYGEWALKLLESLAEKDLTDTFRPVLKDHLYGAAVFQGKFDDQIYMSYILCPRIAHEMIGRYKAFFLQQYSADEQECFRKNPESLAQWVKTNIEVLEGYTCYNGSATPKGTYELKKADRLSRDIAFAAMARSFGIPARLHPADKRPQFLSDQVWKDADLDAVLEQGESKEPADSSAARNSEINGSADSSAVRQGRIRLVKEPGYGGKTEYFADFSLARFDENIFKSMDYERLEWSKFEESIEVLPGIYRLVTTTRIADGTSLLRMTVFTVRPGETAEVALSFRKENSAVPVLGTVPDECTFTLIDSSRVNPVEGNRRTSSDRSRLNLSDENKLNPTDGNQVNLRDVLSAQGLIAAWIEPDKEPSKHLLRELRELSEEFDAWGGRIILNVCGDKLTSSFNADSYEGLPGQAYFSIDQGNRNLNILISELPEKPRMDFPLVFAIDPEKKLRYISAGYKVGIGAELVKILRAINI